MRKLSSLVAALWIGLSGAAQAQAQPVVIELFTSQGCSSCPPADALMHKLAARGDVIALSMHVDYWDYIGWKDEFARPENTARQKAYAHAAGRRSVYTPQMIIGGVDSVVGTHPMDVADMIAKHARESKDVSLKLARTGKRLMIAANARRPAKYDVKVVNFTPKRTSAIKRGENAGKTITYVNVVSNLKVVGKWDGRAPLSVTAQIGSGPVAVFIQRAGHGAIEAAQIAN
ncbi:MAG: DUF1223 domain-containing protein [Planktotalea sp.]|uniref:DUF1223 domain-containing protein n=1 Tax=Planktotalea sp. TaxID=2029877 RepID=UPI003C76A36E